VLTIVYAKHRISEQFTFPGINNPSMTMPSGGVSRSRFAGAAGRIRVPVCEQLHIQTDLRKLRRLRKVTALLSGL